MEKVGLHYYSGKHIKESLNCRSGLLQMGNVGNKQETS